MRIEKIANSDIDPPIFNRDSTASDLTRNWRAGICREDWGNVISYKYDPAIAEAVEAITRELADCFHEGYPRRYFYTRVPGIKKRVHLKLWGDVRTAQRPLAYWFIVNNRLTADFVSLEPSVIVPLQEALAQSAEPILRELEAMLAEQDEPDFRHRPSDYAYDTARQIIRSAYTHHVASAPKPTLAPDGDGGLRIEWQSGRRIVRLIIPHSQNEEGYVYSRRDGPSEIDEPATDEALARRLRSIFAD
jgi:hypothetical protein